MLLVIAILAFSAIFLLVLAIISRPRDQAIRERMLPRGLNAQQIEVQRRLEGSLMQRAIRPITARIGHSLSRLLPQNLLHNVDRLIVASNRNWSVPGFLAVWLVSIAGGVLFVAYIATAGQNLTVPQQFVGAAVILSFATALPYAYLRHLAKKRQHSITRDLPDALDLLVTSVEAGLGIDSAFALVAEKSKGPLAEALSLYLKQVGLGRPRRVALSYVAERTGVHDMISLAASVGQGEELGTSLGDVLRTQAQSLRLLRRQRAETAAQRAPVLMTIPLSLCFLPAMGAVIIVPSLLNLVNFLGDLGSK